MTHQHTIKIDRLVGAESISASAKILAKAKDVTISNCVWDLGEDFTLQHAHRLDLSTETKTVRLYFSDVELTTAGNEHRVKRIEQRLQNAISRLLPQVASPTYTYR